MTYKPALDGIRALAILFVVLYHTYPAQFPGGWAGVDIFFVLSGFLITHILVQEIRVYGQIDFQNFYMRRLLRLTPAFAFFILILTIKAALTNVSFADFLRSAFMAASYMMNWNRAFSWWPQGELGHTWSLAMEEQFYLLWPLILMLVPMQRVGNGVIFLIALIFLWRSALLYSGVDPERTYNGFDTHADSILIGCALALAQNQERNKERLICAMRKMSALPFIIIFFIFTTFKLRDVYEQNFGILISGLCSAWILVTILEGGRISRFFQIKPLVYTGRISYGWYLWHYPLLAYGTYKFPNAEKILFPIIAYLFAAASFHFIEKPFIRLKTIYFSRQNKETFEEKFPNDRVSLKSNH